MRGMRIAGDDPIETGKSFRLDLVVPLDADREVHILLPATSVWCRKEEDDDFYNTGFQFAELKQKDLDAIKMLLVDDFLLVR